MQSAYVISLRGNASGTVRLESAGFGLAAAFALRGGKTAYAAYFIESGTGNIIECLVDGPGRCRIAAQKVCAAAVFDSDGRLVCSGAVGPCGRELAARLAEIKIRAAGLVERAAKEPRAEASAPQAVVISSGSQDDGPQSRGNNASSSRSAPQKGRNGAGAPKMQTSNGSHGTPSPHAAPQNDNFYSPAVSEAAKSIVGMARDLFSQLDGSAASNSGKDSGTGTGVGMRAAPPRKALDEGSYSQESPVSEPNRADPSPELAGGFEAVRNPFPRSYPNSVWRRRSGEAVLYGTAQTRRGRIKITARPSKRGVRRESHERYFTDISGRGYFVKTEPYGETL